MTIFELAELIELQPQVTRLVSQTAVPFAEVEQICQKLSDKNHWESSLAALRKVLSTDTNGMKMLTVNLYAATLAFERYKQLGISQKVFVDTMKCFVRFIDQCNTVYGRWMFDREWWTVRQLSLVLFRVGMLEFEFNQIQGVNCVNIHIPSDANINPSEVLGSFRQAKQFIARHFPEHNDCPFVCDSWLLSPCLKLLLPETSNIVRFLKLFEPRRVDESSTEFMIYVFKTASKDLKNLPENSSLQRNMKAHLLSGGKVGSTFGILKSDVHLVEGKLRKEQQ